MKRDESVFELINKELQRQSRGLELIASENFTSKEVLEAVGSCLTNKYAEGYPGKRYYGGCEVVDEVERLAVERAKKLFGSEHANVQPHAGSQANAAVYLACLKPGDTILGFDLSHGGHLTHGSPVNFSGKLYHPVFYGVDRESGRIDMEQVEAKAHKARPKLIIAGASAYSRDWDFKRFREIADEVGAILMADISHPAGLIAAGLLNNPIPHCHIVTTTTHKTLRGPRGGMIMVGRDFENPWGIATRKGTIRKMSSLIDSAVFPGSQGGPLEHVIAGKAVAFYEALQPEFKDYAQKVIDNSKAMADEFTRLGYRIISGGSDNHMMLIDLRNKGLTGKVAEHALGRADITVNKNMVPFDEQSPFITSGIRIGTAALTTRGLDETHMRQIVHWMNHLLQAPEDEKRTEDIRNKVNRLMEEFPLYA